MFPLIYQVSCFYKIRALKDGDYTSVFNIEVNVVI